MNTDAPKKVLTDEQKSRKNELAKARRAKNKEEKDQAIYSQIPEAVESDDSDEDDIEIDTAEDPVIIDEEDERKRVIAEKRRQSLAIARSKIRPKSQIKAEKDEEIKKITEENERLKMEASKAKDIQQVQQVQQVQPKTKTKIIKKIVRARRPETKREPDNSIDYLTQQTYAEQLQAKLRENMLNKIMMDTFM